MYNTWKYDMICQIRPSVTGGFPSAISVGLLLAKLRPLLLKADKAFERLLMW